MQKTTKEKSRKQLECMDKKNEQIRNRSQICKAADVIKFLVQVDYFGTYDVEQTKKL